MTAVAILALVAGAVAWRLTALRQKRTIARLRANAGRQRINTLALLRRIRQLEDDRESIALTRPDVDVAAERLITETERYLFAQGGELR